MTMIKNCARCGDDHEMDFQELKGDPIETLEGDYTHWAMCPKTNQPVMQIKNCKPIGADVMSILKAAVGGDILLENVSTRLADRRAENDNMPLEIGYNESPVKVVGFEKSGKRMVLILSLDSGAMITLTLDAPSFEKVLLQSVEAGDPGLSELLAVLPSEPGAQIKQIKSTRELLEETRADVRTLVESGLLEGSVFIGSISDLAKATSFAKDESMCVLEFNGTSWCRPITSR